MIKVAFGTGAGLARRRETSPFGKAVKTRQAFAELFAATATLTGAAMTARVIGKAAAAPGSGKPCRAAQARTVCSSCPVGCGFFAEIRSAREGLHPERRKAGRKIAGELVYVF